MWEIFGLIIQDKISRRFYPFSSFSPSKQIFVSFNMKMSCDFGSLFRLQSKETCEYCALQCFKAKCQANMKKKKKKKKLKKSHNIQTNVQSNAAFFKSSYTTHNAVYNFFSFNPQTLSHVWWLWVPYVTIWGFIWIDYYCRYIRHTFKHHTAANKWTRSSTKKCHANMYTLICTYSGCMRQI